MRLSSIPLASFALSASDRLPIPTDEAKPVDLASIYALTKYAQEQAVLIVGEAKTPAALRNASDQFFEWTAPETPIAAAGPAAAKPAAPVPAPTPKPKQRPRALVNAVKLMAADTPDGRVHVGTLGSYLRRTDPGFSPQTYGHSGLVSMLKTYDLLNVRQEAGGHWTVALAADSNPA